MYISTKHPHSAPRTLKLFACVNGNLTSDLVLLTLNALYNSSTR